jgi:ParB family chromosome partitioning protein
MPPQFYNNAIFWVEVEKIRPNPFQPRREFDQGKLEDLARSIRQYGVIQPLTVSRVEIQKDDGGIATEYELIAGERRLRASRLAGIKEVPVLIRAGQDDDKTKLELAIIENLQREDLNPIDRAKAFDQLVKQFGFKHTEVAEKIGKSREYVSNTLRLLMLPPTMQEALRDGKISEGHTRPLLMLADRPQEQDTLFREIMLKRLTVRDTEAIARRIATDRVRKKEYMYSPEILQMERDLSEALGTRVAIEPKEHGGKLSIDYMSEEDLRALLYGLADKMASTKQAPAGYAAATAGASAEVLGSSASQPPSEVVSSTPGSSEESSSPVTDMPSVSEEVSASDVSPAQQLDDRSAEEKWGDENTFDPNSFSL